MALKGVITARAVGKSANHNYRKSKLTMALKNSFVAPGAKVVIIATVSLTSKDMERCDVGVLSITLRHTTAT